MTTIPTLEETVERMKREILEDMDCGRVPLNVVSFSELHDHVDANEYGGFCQELFDPLWKHFSPPGEVAEEMPQGAMDYMNAAQNAIDAWLKERAGLPNEKQIKDIVEKAVQLALDEGCWHIQNALGVKTGDLAGMFWIGYHEDQMLDLFTDYCNAEIQQLIRERKEGTKS